MRPLCFAVVSFDDVQGPHINSTVPEDVQLSASERDAIRFHAFPDSSTVGDLQFSFRFKSAMRESERELNTPPMAASSASPVEYNASVMAVDTTHLFGHVFFRLTRDTTQRRGSWSVAIILIVRYPFVALYKRVMEIVGTTYFASVSADAERAPYGSLDVLEAAFRDASAWPLPRFAQEFELPLLGHVLMFRAPPVRGVAHILDAEHSALAAFSCASPVSNLDSINVYESFCTIVPQLWLLWELVLTGAPILVYATNAAHASDAVYAALSLIAPLEYGGEVQPFFTVQDDTFAAFSTATKGGPLPTALIGTSNPFFFTAFAHWPHFVSVGEVKSDGPQPQRRRGTSQLDQVLAPSSNRARSLDGRESQRARQTIVSNRAGAITPPRAVLDKLLDPRHIERRDPLARVDSWERLKSAASASPSTSADPASTNSSSSARASTALGSALASASSAWSSASTYISEGATRVFRRPETTAMASSVASTVSQAATYLPRLSISISFDDDKDTTKTPETKTETKTSDTSTTVATTPPAVAATSSTTSATPVHVPEPSPKLVELPRDAENMLPEINLLENDGVPAAAATAPVTAAASPAPVEVVASSASTTSGAAAPLASPPVQSPPSTVSKWASTLSSGLATAAEAAAGMAVVPQRALTDAIWPKEVTPVSAESLVQHNNSVLRSHFLQLTITFLAPFESFVLMMVRRGKLLSFSEKEFLEYVRVNRPMREYTSNELDLYQRFCRSVNFHVWLTARLDAARAQMAPDNK